MKASSRLAPLVLVAGSALLGHFLVVTPLVDVLRGLLRGRPMCPVVECTAEGLPIVTEAPMMEAPMVEVVPPAPAPPPPAAWSSRFRASSMSGREIWRGDFGGFVQPMGPDVVVTLRRTMVVLSPEAPPGVLRGIRVDLAESTPDGSWRIAREGRPVEVGIRFRNGEAVTLPGIDLHLPRVGAADLGGRWLVVTLLVENRGGFGFSPLAHAHMDFEMAQGLAEVARRAEEQAPATRVH